MRDHRYQPAAVHTHAYPRDGAPTSTRRADVSTCLSITDCSGIVDREGGRSFSFGALPTSLSRVCSPPLQAATSFPILLFYTHRFHSPRHLLLRLSLPATNPTVRCRLSFTLFLFRYSLVLEPKGKSINSLGEIVTRNMEYWVWAKLPSSPPRRRHRGQGTRYLVERQQCQLHRTLVRSYEDTGPVVIVRRVEDSKSRQPSPFYRSLRLIVVLAHGAPCNVDRERLFEFRNLLSWRRPACVPAWIRIPRLSGRWRRRRRRDICDATHRINFPPVIAVLLSSSFCSRERRSCLYGEMRSGFF